MPTEQCAVIQNQKESSGLDGMDVETREIDHRDLSHGHRGSGKLSLTEVSLSKATPS